MSTDARPKNCNEATRVIELTPAGRGAVAVVLIHGADAVRMVEACFLSAGGKKLSEVPANRILLGRWGGPEGEELIACRRSDCEVEVHCHGGIAAVAAVVERLVQHGCQQLSWRDWLRESEPDPIRAAAQIALAEAPTMRTAAVLLDQWSGALTVAIGSILAAVERRDWRKAAAGLDAILAERALGGHLTMPWQVVLAGRPNVGKSSLMNALVGYQRAIVFDLPGTTRDVVGAATAIDGWPVQLSDTAGLRATTDELEAAGVARASAAVAAADLVLLVDDVSDLQGFDEADWLGAGKRVLRVLNKIDLLPSPQIVTSASWDVRTSAVTGEGIDALIAAIGAKLVPQPLAPGTAVPFTADQTERLEAARAAVGRHDAAGVIAGLRAVLAP